jgi:hypothetical protein
MSTSAFVTVPVTRKARKWAALACAGVDGHSHRSLAIIVDHDSFCSSVPASSRFQELLVACPTGLFWPALPDAVNSRSRPNAASDGCLLPSIELFHLALRRLASTDSASP